MDWKDWLTLLGILLTAGFSIAALIRSNAEDKGSNREWKKMIEDTLQRHSREHKDHYDHDRDEEKHWTERERTMLMDQLDRDRTMVKNQLDRIEGLMRELLMPRSSGTVGRSGKQS